MLINKVSGEIPSSIGSLTALVYVEFLQFDAAAVSSKLLDIDWGPIGACQVTIE